MKTFVDPETHKKLRLGSRGAEALLGRVRDYVEERKQAGVSEVSLCPTKLLAGAKFTCSACVQRFEFDGGDQEAFITSIKEHGRSHGVCQILPVL